MLQFIAMRLPRFLLIILMLVLFLGITGIGVAEKIRVSFTVEPYALLEILTPNLVFPPVNPGEMVEEIVSLLVKANVAWDLRIVGSRSAETEDGTDVDVHSSILVKDHLDMWEKITEISPRIMINQTPTDSDGIPLQIPLRLEADFNDPPGTYETQIEFTLVPQV